MTAQEVYALLAAWAAVYDLEFAGLLKRDSAYAEGILAIGRGGAKPRKDIAAWSEMQAYMSFFYDELYANSTPCEYPANMDAETVRKVLTRFAEGYDPAEDSTAWFERVKALAAEIGFAANMKDYKQNPGAWLGHVGDVSMALRVAVTGREQSPDLCEVMRLLGAERVRARLTGGR
jgi:glutamyl-tRNA synthetase